MKNLSYIKSFIVTSPVEKAQSSGDIYKINKLGKYQCETNKDGWRSLYQMLSMPNSYRPLELMDSGVLTQAATRPVVTKSVFNDVDKLPFED